MATKNPRIQVTLSDDLLTSLSLLAEKNKKSLSNITVDLIREALDLREDFYDIKIAEKLEENHKNQRISAESVWKRLDLE